MPLVKVVLPVPSSPVRRTSTGGLRRFENSLPQWLVSSPECVMISSGTEANLPQQVLTSPRNCSGDFAGQHARNILISFSDEQIRRSTVQIDSQSKNANPVGSAELRGESGENSCQHVTRTALGEARIPRCIHKKLPVW